MRDEGWEGVHEGLDVASPLHQMVKPWPPHSCTPAHTRAQGRASTHAARRTVNLGPGPGSICFSLLRCSAMQCSIRWHSEGSSAHAGLQAYCCGGGGSAKSGWVR